MREILKLAILMTVLTLASTAANAELDIRIKILRDEDGKTKTTHQMRDECVKYCKNMVGVPRCEHAYFYYKVKPNPVCRITSHAEPIPVAKGTYGIWSRMKSRWLKADDFIDKAGGDCTGKLGNAVGKYEADWGPIMCSGGGSNLSCKYSTKGKWSLSLDLSPDGRFVAGHWSHGGKKSGPVWFALNAKCQLTDGKFGYEPNKYTKDWKVKNKL